MVVSDHDEKGSATEPKTGSGYVLFRSECGTATSGSIIAPVAWVPNYLSIVPSCCCCRSIPDMAPIRWMVIPPVPVIQHLHLFHTLPEMKAFQNQLYKSMPDPAWPKARLWSFRDNNFSGPISIKMFLPCGKLLCGAVSTEGLMQSDTTPEVSRLYGWWRCGFLATTDYYPPPEYCAPVIWM